MRRLDDGIALHFERYRRSFIPSGRYNSGVCTCVCTCACESESGMRAGTYSCCGGRRRAGFIARCWSIPCVCSCAFAVVGYGGSSSLGCLTGGWSSGSRGGGCCVVWGWKIEGDANTATDPLGEGRGRWIVYVNGLCILDEGGVFTLVVGRRAFRQNLGLQGAGEAGRAAQTLVVCRRAASVCYP